MSLVRPSVVAFVLLLAGWLGIYAVTARLSEV